MDEHDPAFSEEASAQQAPCAPDIPGAPGAALAATSPSAATSLALRSGYSIQAIESAEVNLVHLKAPDGRICITITLRPEGPAVEVRAGSLAIAADGDLRIDCARLAIRTEEDLAIQAGRDISMSARGTLKTEGFSQHVKARLGDVHVEANDDVRLDGERIRLNSPPTPAEAPRRCASTSEESGGTPVKGG